MMEKLRGIWYNEAKKKGALPLEQNEIAQSSGEAKMMEQLYRVLLVDDEEEIRAGISRKIEWDQLGFGLVGEASNGQEALEIAEQLLPDVVLTDIKMPFMDGLELCRRLQKTLPAAKVVMFSGFDEFEYARQAVGMNVCEYILKPINAAALNEVLVRLKEQMDRQRIERRDVETLRRRYEASLPVLRELFYARLLDGQIPAEQIQNRAAQYELDLPDGEWIVVLFRVDEREPSFHHDEALLSLQEFLVNQRDDLEWPVHTALYNDTIAMLVKTQTVYPLLEELERLRSLAQSELGMEITAGVGLVCKSLAEIRKSCIGAFSALDYRVVMGNQKVIYIGDLEPDLSASVSLGEEDQHQLASAIKLGEEGQVSEIIRRLIGRIRDTRIDLPQCQLFLMEFSTHLIRLARAGGVGLEEVFGSSFTGAVPINQFRSYEELENWCVEKGVCLRRLLGQQRTDSAGRVIERAKSFIDQHYSDSELSVEKLCAYLHLSPAYFSTVFKRETGMSFTAYMTGVRMEEAARLLRETDDKTYLIAEKTGYTDANYFSYVFKRKYSMSPSKYRLGEKAPDGK